MKRPRSTRVRGWRWRRNPLRRRSDVVDAWLLLAAWTVALVSGLVVGLLTADAVGHMTPRPAPSRPAATALVDPESAQSPSPRGAGDAPQPRHPATGQSPGGRAVAALMAAAATGGLVWAGTRAVRSRIDERRMEQWAAAWERFDAHRGPRTG
ncbi:hypothetical protein [Streptomyces sp. NPDC048192]|uniref:hypothetical protein n=1 Tax=Streptomyces sp. NPDC048192 TaxID=3365510 RepID=UPI00371F283D